MRRYALVTHQVISKQPEVLARSAQEDWNVTRGPSTAMDRARNVGYLIEAVCSMKRLTSGWFGFNCRECSQASTAMRRHAGLFSRKYIFT